LTEWVNDDYGPSSTQEQLDQANEAVRSVGTNALEFWVTMLGSTNDSRLTGIRNSIFAKGSGFHRPDAAERSYLAFCALYILGADAEPAIPELRNLLEYRQTAPNAHATILLAGLGPEGVEILTSALANTNMQMRFEIAMNLAWNGRPPNFNNLALNGGGPWEWPKPAMQAIVPALQRCLRDRDLNVRVLSAQSLGFLAADATNTVPALMEFLDGATNAMERTTALEALAKFGTAAQPARAEITRFLEDSDRQTRRSATNAIEKIGPEDAKAGVK
jgi:hypothetical protein